MRKLLIAASLLTLAACTSENGMKSDFVAGSWWESLCHANKGIWNNAPNGSCTAHRPIDVKG